MISEIWSLDDWQVVLIEEFKSIKIYEILSIFFPKSFGIILLKKLVYITNKISHKSKPNNQSIMHKKILKNNEKNIKKRKPKNMKNREKKHLWIWDRCPNQSSVYLGRSLRLINSDLISLCWQWGMRSPYFSRFYNHHIALAFKWNCAPSFAQEWFDAIKCGEC